MNELRKLFDLTGRVAVITGGAGLLGRQHAAVIGEAGGWWQNELVRASQHVRVFTDA